MRITPNDPDTCLHEDLDVARTEVRDGGGRLHYITITVTCDDCETVLQASTHAPARKKL